MMPFPYKRPRGKRAGQRVKQKQKLRDAMAANRSEKQNEEENSNENARHSEGNDRKKMPWENERKRRHSDMLKDPYKGPREFMEAGVRGFLVTTLPDREEHALDEAVKSLRKACIKLYGGIKPVRREDASFAKGYVMVDFMDPEKVIDIPNPNAPPKTEEQQATEAVTEVKESEAMEEEPKEKVPAEGETTEEVKEETGEVKSEDQKEDGSGEKPPEKTKEEKEKEERKKKEEWRRKKKEEEMKGKSPLMLSTHKFKSFRTELRNIMFIKSDVMEPGIVATTVFDLIMDRRPLFTDCINQMLPVHGVCENDYKQLEIMCRRVLAPYVGEHHEEPPSFGVMLVDKMSDPGSEMLLEVVRSAIWCLNPLAYQCSPWAEPYVVVHLEIIGSKIILSAMTEYMKYRQYSPFACHEMGVGKPQDEVFVLKEMEREEREREERERLEKEARREAASKSKKKKKEEAKAAKEAKEDSGKKKKASKTEEEKGKTPKDKKEETTPEAKGETTMEVGEGEKPEENGQTNPEAKDEEEKKEDPQEEPIEEPIQVEEPKELTEDTKEEVAEETETIQPIEEKNEEDTSEVEAKKSTRKTRRSKS